MFTSNPTKIWPTNKFLNSSSTRNPFNLFIATNNQICNIHYSQLDEKYKLEKNL